MKEVAAAVIAGKEWRATHRRTGFVASEQESAIALMVRKAIKVGLADDWSELTGSEELNHWMLTQLKESYYQASRRTFSARALHSRCCGKHRFLAADQCASPGSGRSHTVACVPSLPPLPT